MARPPNFSFERQQRDIAKAAKKAAKAAAKASKSGRDEPAGDTATTESGTKPRE